MNFSIEFEFELIKIRVLNYIKMIVNKIAYIPRLKGYFYLDKFPVSTYGLDEQTFSLDQNDALLSTRMCDFRHLYL